jgi:hypothetical protein
MDEPTDEQIHDFWRWVRENQHQLLECYDGPGKDTEKLADLLGARLDELTMKLSWEMGPTRSPGYKTFLALSPSGVRKRLEFTRRAVRIGQEYGLVLELLPAKPRRVYGGTTIEFVLGENAGVYLDVSQWDYDLKAFRDKDGRCFFDIFLVPDFISPVYVGKDYLTVAWTMLDGLLGEEFVIDRVGKVAVVPRAEVECTWNIRKLLEHLEGIIRREEGEPA